MPKEIRIEIPEEGEIWCQLLDRTEEGEGPDVRILEVDEFGRTYFEWLTPAYLVENSLPTLTFADRFSFVRPCE